MNRLKKEINLGFTEEKFVNGIHMCYIYNDEKERRKIMSHYIKSGLLNGERVAYFADIATKDDINDYVNNLGCELPANIEKDQLVLTYAVNTYCPSGEFKPQQMTDTLINFYNDTIEKGFSLSRVTGEMSWALNNNIHGKERLVEYECRLNILFEDYPVTAICQYDANKFDGGTLFKILNVHPLMVVRGQIVYNPYYIQPQEFLAKYL
ncbi:MAG: MEDS domain-containing protein [Candidatus Magnetoovum sp. WYHC-5]|nr:MEDS domain-containing protein [Candidatus Magnetoovum sp. WYHC-5]